LIVVFAIIAAAFALPAEDARDKRAVYATYGAYPYAYSAGVPAISTYSAYPSVSAYSAVPSVYAGYPYGGVSFY
jgi:hypothetical protein